MSTYANISNPIDLKKHARVAREYTLKDMQSDIRILDYKVEVLDNKVDNNFEVLDSKIEVLNNKVEVLDNKVEVLTTKVEVLNTKVDSNFELLNTKIDNVVSMKKWVVLMFITILLALAALIGPNIIAFFS